MEDSALRPAPHAKVLHNSSNSGARTECDTDGARSGQRAHDLYTTALAILSSYLYQYESTQHLDTWTIASTVLVHLCKQERPRQTSAPLCESRAVGDIVRARTVLAAVPESRP